MLPKMHVLMDSHKLIKNSHENLTERHLKCYSEQYSGQFVQRELTVNARQR